MSSPAARMRICRQCPNFRAFSAFSTCKVCGCLLHLKIKIKSQSCPEKKWEAVDEWSQPVLRDDGTYEK